MLVRRYGRDPFNDFRQSFELINSVLNSVEDTTKESVEEKYDFTPAVNTREGKDAYYIEFDIAGVKKEDINVDIEENRVIISGEKRLREEKEGEKYHKIESYYGKFKRSFALPDDADMENISAESNDGILEITIAKLEKSSIEKTRRIKIN
jgi:HSP20 family protein